MLIHFGRELADEIGATIGKNESVIRALQNLAQARVQGDHVITGDPGTISAITNHSALNSTTRGVFKKIDSELSQLGALKDKLKAYIEIKRLSGPSLIQIVDTQRIIDIPLNRFERNDITQPTFLIAENLLDCQLYLRFSSWYAEHYWNGKIPAKLSAIFVPGGGDTTDRVLGHFSEEQRYLALSITDSDVKLPSGNTGQTAKKCATLSLTHTCHHIVIPVRSAENLLSAAQIDEILNAKHERHALLENLQRLSHLAGKEAWKHLPIKDGIHLLVGPTRPGTEEDFWNKNAPPNPIHLDGFLLPRISSKLLQWAVDHFRSTDPRSLDDDSQLLEIWRTLALLVASWTCSTSPMRA